MIVQDSKSWVKLIKQDVNESNSLYKTRYLITGFVDNTNVDGEGSMGEASITLGRQITNKFWYGLKYDSYLEELIAKYLESSEELSAFMEKKPKKVEENNSITEDDSSTKENNSSTTEESSSTKESDIDLEGDTTHATSVKKEDFSKVIPTNDDIKTMEKLEEPEEPTTRKDIELIEEEVREVEEVSQGRNGGDPNPHYIS
jgi:hypothetical protein